MYTNVLVITNIDHLAKSFANISNTLFVFLLKALSLASLRTPNHISACGKRQSIVKAAVCVCVCVAAQSTVCHTTLN